jgi:hypothetical protein
MKGHAVPPRLTLAATIIPFAAGLLLAMAPRLLTAQTYWRVPGALGGAMVGAGAGWAMDIARWGGGGSDEPFRGPTLALTPIGIGVGAVLGFIGGLDADRKLARGNTLTRGGRFRLRVATFLAPVAVGSAIAFTIINPSDEGRCVPYSGPDPNIICTYQAPDPKGMSDEMVALWGIGGGALVGLIAQHKFAPALWPAVRVGVAPDGRGLAVSIPLGW